MEMGRRSWLVYGLLAAVWVLVLGWQVEEHLRVRNVAKTDLRNRSKDIANTLSAIIRGMRFRGAISQERLEPVLNELIHGGTNELIKSSELLSIVLLNATNGTVASAGRPIEQYLHRDDFLQEGEHWGPRSVTLVNPVDLGASLSTEGVTNTLILPPLSAFTNRTSEPGRDFSRRGPPPPPPPPELAHPDGPNDPAMTNPPPGGGKAARASRGAGPGAHSGCGAWTRPSCNPWSRSERCTGWCSPCPPRQCWRQPTMICGCER